MDPFAGVSDIVEVLRLVHNPPPHDPLILQVPYGKPTTAIYRALSQVDAERLVAVAAETPGMLRTVASYLACFSKVGLGACQRALLAQDDPYPAHAFRGGGEDVAEALFEILKRSIRDEDRLLLDHTLCALAWARSPRAIEAMMGWARERPSWSKALHIPPDAYARVAGFEIKAGTVRELTLPGAFKLVPTDEMGAAERVELFARESSGLQCGRCLRPATVLTQFDSTSLPELQGIVPSTVVTCLECAPYGTVFVRRNPAAGWEWFASDVHAAEPGEGWGLAPRAARLVPRTPWESVDWCQADGVSQIGGHPAWINDPEYPPCPSCARSMSTVMQIALEDFFRAEGVFYVHYCAGCAAVGVSYQQT